MTLKPHRMNKNKPQRRLEKLNLSIIKKEEEEIKQTKLIPIKKASKRPEILLPPAEEKYIKVKKHDFL